LRRRRYFSLWKGGDGDARSSTTSYHACKDNKQKEVTMFSKKFFQSVVFCSGVILVLAMCLGLSGSIAMAGSGCPDDDQFTTEFRLQDCTFDNNDSKGANRYFSLHPGYQLVLEGEEDGEEIRALIKVTNDKERITVPGIGPVWTRVVEEWEWVDDVLVEVSRNFFARCEQTNDIYYFGEDVDICEAGLVLVDGVFLCEGEEPDHEGAWRAGEHGAKAGLIMPGTVLLGSRYFQEIAWDVGAVDRGENVEMGLTAADPNGGPDFTGCVMVVDTNPADGICKTKDGDVKIYCPGVGLVMDEELELVCYGFECDEE
jgi:hypothetical protein